MNNDADANQELAEDDLELNISAEELEDIREQGRKKFYKFRTVEPSTLEEMENLVSSYVKAILKKRKVSDSD